MSTEKSKFRAGIKADNAGPNAILTLMEAAIYLGISQTTMRRWATAVPPRIPSTKDYFGRKYRFKASDLDAFIQEQGMAHS